MEIRVSTKLTAEMEKENQKKLKTGSFWAMIIGIIGLIAYIVVSVACFDEGEEPKWLEIFLYAFSVLFAIGLIFFLTTKNLIKKAVANGFTNEYLFTEEFATVTSYRGGEKVGEIKHYYNEFTKIRKTEYYLFLHLGVRGAYPIELCKINEEELAIVCAWVAKWLPNKKKGM